MCETRGVTRTGGTLFEGTDLFPDNIYRGQRCCFVFPRITIRGDKANQARCILDTSHVSN